MRCVVGWVLLEIGMLLRTVFLDAMVEVCWLEPHWRGEDGGDGERHSVSGTEVGVPGLPLLLSPAAEGPAGCSSFLTVVGSLLREYHFHPPSVTHLPV